MRRCWARWLSVAVGSLFLAGAIELAADDPAADTSNKLSAQELADGWILLFDGETMFGWQANSNANWHVADGVLAVSEGEPGLLGTTSPFGDFALKLDFRRQEKTNSGVFLRTAVKPTDPTVDCYELNIAAPDVALGRPVASPGGKKRPPRPMRPTNGRAFEVTAIGGHFVARLDGQVVLRLHRSQAARPGAHRFAVQHRKSRIPLDQTEAAGLEDLLAGNRPPTIRSSRLDGLSR